MTYNEMLNRVAYENAMIKMASRMTKKAEDEEKTIGQKTDEVLKDTKEKATGMWNDFKNWAGNNKGMLTGVGTAAVAAPAIDYGLGQIDWFKRRQLLQKLLAGFGAAGLAIPAAHFGPQLFASNDGKKDEKKDEKPAADAATAAG